ncbi:GAF domain-containing protein [bacterium]|nr:MAG: GAF domain-containing protein [bacterium]
MNDSVRILEALAHAGSSEELYHELVHGWKDQLKAESVDFLLREPGDGLLMKASSVFPEMTNRMRLGKGVGLSGQAISKGKAVYVSENAQTDERYARYPNTEGHVFEALAAFPLLRKEGAALGVVLVRYLKPNPFSVSERERLEGMAKTTSQVVEGFLHAYEAGTRLNRLGALSEVSKTIAASPYLEEILQLLVNLTAQQFNYKVCTVRLLDESRGELVLRATQATVKAYQRKRAIKLGESIAGRAISENRPVIVRDVQSDEDYIGHDLAAEQGLRSMICVPLTLQDRPVGVLSCYTEEVHEFQPDEIKALETLAKQAAVSIEHAKVQVRTTLMQEMHHRVKNNLQQVASLLRLQMRHSSTKTLEEALNECLNRILAISAVHDLLSREDLDHVSIKEISQSLVHHQQSIILPSKTIKFQVRGSDVKLNMTQATQLALVLNELIQNAIEHGFEKADAGEVHINVEENNEELSVWVSNSGDQLPDGFDPTVFSHLGLKLVDNLARSLGGRFRLNNVLGWTVAEVKFPRATGE